MTVVDLIHRLFCKLPGFRIIGSHRGYLRLQPLVIVCDKDNLFGQPFIRHICLPHASQKGLCRYSRVREPLQLLGRKPKVVTGDRVICGSNAIWG
jgi:hypothetical protein